MPTASELPIDTNASANDMAESMFGNGISIVSSSYTGATGASGTYSNGDATAPGITPSDTGVILSTGNATDITNSSGDVNTSAGTSTSHGTSGDSDLESISGQTTFDAAVFEAEFIPEGGTLTMQIVFSSEEYLEYVDAGFNDAVGIWVNGVQAELTVGTGDISIDNINDTTNENLYIDNAQSDDSHNTEMDGFTITLTLKAPVTPGVTNTIKIGIADGGDGSYDSNLLIAGNSVQTALIAGDDEISVNVGQDINVDLLANDESTNNSELTITHINGQPVSVGDSVTLSSGEVIELTADGFVLATANDEVAENVFSYTVEDEDGNSDVGFVTLTTTPCFTSGTRILTPQGERPVETLKPGDLVETMDHGPKPLLWVGKSERIAHGRDAPIEIDEGTLGAKTCTEVSPLHRLLIRDPDAMVLYGSYEILVQARHLINNRTIRRKDRGGRVVYFHLLFDKHEIIEGNGILSESFQPGKQTEASFDPSLNDDLKCIMKRNNIDVMYSARPSLKKHEATVLNSRKTELTSATSQVRKKYSFN
ncbi:hypothetical protein ASD8599_01717 [Ascidiaceihabitans donghaensis]|uniref:Hedgehog/Intein (Hint) domain-containing protein n=1 Tax=Ascidiaceihabitans donghaensis TaxID=1510460 RepID=A0A2R8BD30_9RHOB|nr:choice-of-anchor L domain-containing protein [Ascidiaceihabitans donghaensis]SPH20976.1 hypothetical protein ASD8599_01717 [Ascidiaceihabitans donghaensis]